MRATFSFSGVALFSDDKGTVSLACSSSTLTDLHSTYLRVRQPAKSQLWLTQQNLARLGLRENKALRRKVLKVMREQMLQESFLAR